MFYIQKGLVTEGDRTSFEILSFFVNFYLGYLTDIACNTLCLILSYRIESYTYKLKSAVAYLSVVFSITDHNARGPGSLLGVAGYGMLVTEFIRSSNKYLG